MRARMALFKAKQSILIRAVKLNNKPRQMLIASPKGSVPVLVVNDMVIEESLELMLWALSESDPLDLLQSTQKNNVKQMVSLINHFEKQFVPALEAYSCAKRYREDNTPACRLACEKQLQQLETRLNTHTFLFSDSESLVDIALVPFIRKFARIEKQCWRDNNYPKLRSWLNNYLQSPMFTKIMAQHELWVDHQQDIVFAL